MGQKLYAPRSIDTRASKRKSSASIPLIVKKLDTHNINKETIRKNATSYLQQLKKQTVRFLQSSTITLNIKVLGNIVYFFEEQKKRKYEKGA